MQLDFTNDTITPDVSTTLTVGGTGGILVATGTTAQRPSTTNGIMRYNTDINRLEAVIAGTWRNFDITQQEDAVRCATTTNLTLTAPGAIIDGVTLVAGDRVLVKDQTSTVDNGIYVWNGAAVAMTRSADMSLDWDSAVPGRIIFTNEGTVAQFENFRFVVATGGTFGVTPIVVTGGWWQSGRITIGDKSAPARAATGSVTQTMFSVIDTTANLRTWKYAAGGTSVVTGLEMAIGTNDDVANAANTWWDMSLSSDTQEGVRFARRTGGTVAPKMFLDANGRMTIGTSVLASGATGAALASTAGVGLYVNSTDAIKSPVGTTAQRPTGSVGLTRWNSTLGDNEFFNGTEWVQTGFTILQQISGNFAQATGTTTIPYDNTTPLNTEGTAVWTETITPQSVNSVIRIDLSSLFGYTTANATVTAALFRGAVCLEVKSMRMIGSGTLGGSAQGSAPFSMNLVDNPASVATETYTLRVGSSSGTWNFARSDTQTYNGSAVGHFILQEIL